VERKSRNRGRDPKGTRQKMQKNLIQQSAEKYLEKRKGRNLPNESTKTIPRPHLSPSSRLIGSARLMTPTSTIWAVLASCLLTWRKRKSSRTEWMGVPSPGIKKSSFIE